MESVSPILIANEAIRRFDKILDKCGGLTTSRALEVTDFNKNVHVSNVITTILETHSMEKLAYYYNELESLLADFIAISHEESEFSGAALPNTPILTHDLNDNIQKFISYITIANAAIQPLAKDEIGAIQTHRLLTLIESKKKEMGKGFFYEFTKGDLNRAQQLINELRSEVESSDLFDKDHRRRILLRLEKLQSEMHKKMSDMDRIWGLVGDAGVIIGKFGNNAKPFVDRIRELSQIAWRTQSRAEELPSGSTNPMIGPDNK